MAWKYFGIEAIKFTRYDLVLKELADALAERIGDGRSLCSSGTKLSIEEAAAIMNQLEILDNTNYYNPFVRQENNTNIPYTSFYAADILDHYHMDPVFFKKSFKRMFDPMWAFQRQLIIDAMRWRKYPFNSSIAKYTDAKLYGLQQQDSFETCCDAVRKGEHIEQRIRDSGFYMYREKEKYNIKIWVSALEITGFDSLRFYMHMYSKIFSHDLDYGRFHPFGPITEPDRSFLLRSVSDQPQIHPLLTTEQRAQFQINQPQDGEIYNFNFQFSPVYCYDTPGGFNFYEPNFNIVPN